MRSTATNTHHGRNIRRLREILNIKQEAIASELSISQQAISKLESKEVIDDEVLDKVSETMGISTHAIKNFNEEAAVNIIANTFNNSSASVVYKTSFNPVDKITELYERLLEAEQKKNCMARRENG